MNNKLPKVFANNKKVNSNNEILFYSKNIVDKPPVINNKFQALTINKKINDLFNQKNFVYKMPVTVFLKEEKINTYLIARNKKYIITFDNRRIKIDDILDIKENKNN